MSRRLKMLSRPEQNVAGVAAAGDEVVEAVEAAQHRRLAAAGRADESGDLVFRDGHRNGMERLVLVIEDAVIAHVDEVVVGQRFGRRQGPMAGNVQGGIELGGGKFQVHRASFSGVKMRWAMMLVTVTSATKTSEALQASWI